MTGAGTFARHGQVHGFRLPLAKSPRNFADLSRLLQENLQPLLVAGTRPGLYAVHPGNSYDNGGASVEFTDYGPREFAESFHHLWIFAATNRFAIEGPVATYCDPDHGLLHACERAILDLQSTMITTAVVVFLNLHDRDTTGPGCDFMAAFSSGSVEWLTGLTRGLRQGDSDAPSLAERDFRFADE